jgi:outer membrane protein, multidrug efflux system
MKPVGLGISFLVLSGCSTWLPAEHSTPSLRSDAPVILSATSGQPTSGWPMQAWWQRYDDPILNDLVARALRDSPSLTQAEARFEVANQAVRIQSAQSGLQVSAQASVMRLRLSDNGLLPTTFLGFNWYNQADLGLKASYDFDWWHKRERLTNAAVFQSRAAQAEQLAAAIALSGSVVQSYLGWQADQAQLANIDAQLALLYKQQAINTARINAALENADDSYRLEAQRAALRQQRVQWQYSAQVRRVLIAALAGVSEADLPAFTVKPTTNFDAAVPNNLTVDLLAHRADIASAYWQVKANEQQLGAARAEFMPDISLNVLAALSSIGLGKLLNTGSAAPNIGLALHLPLFDSGLLKAQYGARAAEVDAAVANYNQTVVNAARDVASALLQLQRVDAEQQQHAMQMRALTQLLDSANHRYQQGLTDLRPVLAAQQTLLQQQATYSALQAARATADMQLQLALGGGYAARLRDAETSAGPVSPSPVLQ